MLRLRRSAAQTAGCSASRREDDLRRSRLRPLARRPNLNCALPPYLVSSSFSPHLTRPFPCRLLPPPPRRHSRSLPWALCTAGATQRTAPRSALLGCMFQVSQLTLQLLFRFFGVPYADIPARFRNSIPKTSWEGNEWDGKKLGCAPIHTPLTFQSY